MFHKAQGWGKMPGAGSHVHRGNQPIDVVMRRDGQLKTRRRNRLAIGAQRMQTGLSSVSWAASFCNACVSVHGRVHEWGATGSSTQLQRCESWRRWWLQALPSPLSMLWSHRTAYRECFGLAHKQAGWFSERPAHHVTASERDISVGSGRTHAHPVCTVFVDLLTVRAPASLAADGPLPRGFVSFFFWLCVAQEL